MRGKQYTDNPKRLEAVRQRFEQWRRGRKGKSRIPEELWLQATKLGCKYGVYRTARTLSLDYRGLKDRVAVAGNPLRKRNRKATFIEVTPDECGFSECAVEIESASGSSFRVQLKGAAVSEVSSLAKVFYESESCCN